MARNGVLRLVATLRIGEGKLQTFKELANEAINAAKKNEPGTLTYEWYLSADETTCHILEQYQNSEAILAHVTGEIGTQILPKILEVAELAGIDVHGIPSPEAAEVAASFGARTFSPFGGFTR
ncbi:MAG: antibiotic biosynthesis monooxygenase [Chloroflexi bacterium]|nr:antibiotic biosynthesis monooxygenase [Chloroflexota bacterium]